MARPYGGTAIGRGTSAATRKPASRRAPGLTTLLLLSRSLTVSRCRRRPSPRPPVGLVEQGRVIGRLSSSAANQAPRAVRDPAAETKRTAARVVFDRLGAIPDADNIRRATTQTANRPACRRRRCQSGPRRTASSRPIALTHRPSHSPGVTAGGKGPACHKPTEVSYG
jgi:hypothetical protein